MKELMTKVFDELNESGKIEEIITKKIEASIEEIFSDMFRSYGDFGKIVKDKIKEQMLPQIEKYDFSEHTVKVQDVLSRVIEEVNKDHVKILENFEDIMVVETPREINLESLLEIYAKNCGEHVDTYGMEICYDDEPSYECLECNVCVEESKDYFRTKRVLKFTCKQDGKLEKIVELNESYNKEYHYLYNVDSIDYTNLNKMDHFDIQIMKMKNNFTHVDIEDDDVTIDDVEVKAEPEYSCQ